MEHQRSVHKGTPPWNTTMEHHHGTPPWNTSGASTREHQWSVHKGTCHMDNQKNQKSWFYQRREVRRGQKRSEERSEREREETRGIDRGSGGNLAPHFFEVASEIFAVKHLPLPQRCTSEAYRDTPEEEPEEEPETHQKKNQNQRCTSEAYRDAYRTEVYC